jgi:hypothetical protein
MNEDAAGFGPRRFLLAQAARLPQRASASITPRM